MRRTKYTVMVLAILLGAFILSSSPADAQQNPNQPNCPSGGYPPCNNGNGNSTEVKNFGMFRAGEQFNKEDCGFDANASTTLTFNGADAGRRAAGADGCVRMQVTIGQQRRVTFNDRTFTGRCGQNAIVVTGPSASGTRTVTNNFELNCAGGVADNNLPRTGSDLAPVAAAAIGLTALGGLLVVAARRRRERTG